MMIFGKKNQGLTIFEGDYSQLRPELTINEFHISREIRDKCDFDESLFASTGNVILSNTKAVRLFAKKLNDLLAREIPDPVEAGKLMVKAGQLNAMGLIDEIFHYVCAMYRRDINTSVFDVLLELLDEEFGTEAIDGLLSAFNKDFPPTAIFRGEVGFQEYLEKQGLDPVTGSTRSNRASTLEEMILLRLANENPAFKPFYFMFGDDNLKMSFLYDIVWGRIQAFFMGQPGFGPNGNTLIAMLKEPVKFSPHSLKGQLDYIRTHWQTLLGEWLSRLLSGMDMISEEEKAAWAPLNIDPAAGIDMEPYSYDSLMKEYERFSPDRDWMPKVVLMAKTVLVWLDQLSRKYKQDITRLDQIPDEELDLLAQRGFTGLWLIGLWERSHASKRIKQICGNPEAAASAYSLYDYDIAQGLGGWDAVDNLRRRLWVRGIRLASDMVPNHTGMDSHWINDRPDLFVQTRDCPFPGYTFNGENLSLNDRVGVYLEDNYFNKTDCAVVFKRVDHHTGDVRYIYHGNDGTGMPWNDTAQIDFLNPEAREAVMQEILHVARNFPIIRFDAAMVLAKKHIRRLWYPQPGCGGDIASRSDYALSPEEFERRIPNEFWREVVDRVAQEVPDTLLLAEAFWMMEGYFVRTLGMHRVYNSAFMNMLKREENFKYRSTIKNTIEFDPQILKRYVNFMNNPDEETAVAQFGKDDKYFGVCTLMVTMPGLPMFGHGQIEGFTEKYGMEFTKAYWDETPDENLIQRHQREIFPLMKKRYLFAEIENFLFYDVWNEGQVNENVFAYSNRCGTERAVVFYNNVYQQASGWIKESCKYAVKTGNGDEIRMETRSIGHALGLNPDPKNYCIFREQRSGLWFIRSAADICNNGLYLHLNGFETQVMMDISQVTDDETGKYGILCETLAGSGVSDIDTALREIFLKDLYKAFTAVVSPEFLDQMAIFGMTPVQLKNTNAQKKVPTVTAIVEAMEEPMKNWFAVADEFIEGNYGAAQVVDRKLCGKMDSGEKLWAGFKKSFTQLLKNFAEGQELVASSIRETVAQTASKTAAKETLAEAPSQVTSAEVAAEPATEVVVETSSFEVRLAQGVLSRPAVTQMLAGMAVVASLQSVLGNKATAKDAAALVSLWGLERKLQDLLLNRGVPVAATSLPLKTMVVVLPFMDLLNQLKQDNATGKLDDKAVKKVAGIMVNTIVHSKAAGAVAGINLFDNVLWFNHELMSDALWYAVAVSAYLGGGLTASIKEGLEAVAKILADAQKKAEYRADQLCEILPPPEVKKPKATKATSKDKQEEEKEDKTSATEKSKAKVEQQAKKDSKAEKKAEESDTKIVKK